VESPDSKNDEQSSVPDYEVEPVPRLPRARHTKLSKMALFRTAMLAMLLFAVLALRRPCADGVSKFIGSFDGKPDAGAEAPPRRTVLPPGEYVKIDGDLTEERLKQIRERAAKRAAAHRDAGVDAAANDKAKAKTATDAAPAHNTPKR